MEVILGLEPPEDRKDTSPVKKARVAIYHWILVSFGATMPWCHCVDPIPHREELPLAFLVGLVMCDLQMSSINFRVELIAVYSYHYVLPRYSTPLG